MAERVLGKYTLLRQLAVGGMAEIYVASARGVGGFEKLVALKVIHPNYSADPEFMQMLVDEAKLAVQLQHSNIVQTFDLGRVEDSYYIVMELIDGSDLHKVLKRTVDEDKYLPFEAAAYIAHEVATGLDYAHAARGPDGRPLQLVHRDVSPQNVLVSFSGEVKLVDFGIAKAASRGRHTAAGVIKGKYYYMSPEQAWGDPVDHRTDVFSTGILLYEMLVGEMMYWEEDMDRLLDQVRKAELAPPSSRRAEVPPELDAIAMRALAKRPRDRYATAGALAQDLLEWMRKAAPDFASARVGQFVRELIGAGKQEIPKQRSAREATAEVIDLDSVELVDENSLIFRLSDLKPPAPKSEPPARHPSQSTRAAGSDWGEPDETVVEDSPMVRSARPPPDTAPEAAEDKPTEQMRAAKLATFAEDEGEVTRTESGPPDVEGHTLDQAAPLPGVRGLSSPTVGPAQLAGRTAGPQGRAVPRPVPEERAGQVARPVPPPSPPQPPTAPERRLSPLAIADPARHPPTAEVETSEWNFAHAASVMLDPIAPPPPPSPPRTAETAPLLPSMIAAEAAAQAIAAPPPIPPPPRGPETAPIAPVPSRPPPPPAGAPPGWPWSAPAGPGADPTSSLASGPQIQLQSSLYELKRRGGRVWLLVALLSGGAAAIIALALVLVSTGVDRGTIEVISLPAGANVKVDGRDMPGTTPLRIDEQELKVTHHVAVTLSGYDTWERDVTFEWASREVSLHVVLVPLTGALHVDSTPEGAEAIVNGRFRGQTPLEVNDLLPTQDVSVELRLRGFRVERRSVPWLGRRRLAISVPLARTQ